MAEEQKIRCYDKNTLHSFLDKKERELTDALLSKMSLYDTYVEDVPYIQGQLTMLKEVRKVCENRGRY